MGRHDARELLVEALELVREPFVVEAQQVQDRRVQIADVDWVLGHVEAELVGRAVAPAPASCRRRRATS